ncbi:MAG: hypothetical protein QNJ84_10600 [Alphaproteobacteria bacterium]|nr:hypothetical protein [Alphaproteobacteria bacterium]
MSSSFNHHFKQAARPKKRAAPFSIRMSEDERAQLSREAHERHLRLGTYIRGKLFENTRQRRSPIDYTMLGRVLAALGESELASSLCLLAVAAEHGALTVDDALEADLKAACADIEAMRSMLVSALGLRESQ